MWFNFWNSEHEEGFLKESGQKGREEAGLGGERRREPRRASPVTQTLDSALLCSCCLGQLARSAASLGPASSEGSVVLLATEAVHTPLMEFLSLHFPVRTEPASLTLLLSLRKLFFFFSPLPHTHSLIQTTSGNFSLYHIKGKQIEKEMGAGRGEYSSRHTEQ